MTGDTHDLTRHGPRIPNVRDPEARAHMLHIILSALDQRRQRRQRHHHEETRRMNQARTTGPTIGETIDLIRRTTGNTDDLCRNLLGIDPDMRLSTLHRLIATTNERTA